MNRIPKHPGKPQGSDTVPAWLTPGEFVMNAEAARMFSPEIQAMNDQGRAVQAAQGGTIPQMGEVPIPTTHNPSAAYSAGGDVSSEEPAWKQHIRIREGGLKRKIYIDTEGYATVGIGHKLPDSYKSQEGQSPFSDSELNNFFEADVAQATANAQHNVSSFSSLSVPQQGGLINQAFQLGRTGQSKFKNMIKAINEGNMTEAGAQALDSKWHGQTPKRSTDLSRVLQGQETKMEYNRGGGVPQYLGLGDWVKSLFVNEEEEKLNPNFFDIVGKEGIPSTLGIPMQPYNMDEYNKNKNMVNVQTEINTDGSYFNQPYGTDSDRMDSNFKVPEPPRYSDAALENNSSNALQGVPYGSLNDPDLGALITQGDKTAEKVMKERANKARIALEYVPNQFPEVDQRRLYDEQAKVGGVIPQGAGVNLPQVPNVLPSNEQGSNFQPVQNVLPSNEQGSNFTPPQAPRMVPSLDAMARKRLTEEAIKSGDPRALQQFNKGMTNIIPDQNYGSGMNLNEKARASNKFLRPGEFSSSNIPTGPASYDQTPPRITADIDIGEGSFGYGQFKRPNNPTSKDLMRNSKGEHALRGSLGAPMDPVNVDANDPRIGAVESYGVPKDGMPPEEQKSWMDNFNIKNGLASLGQGQLLTNPIAEITGAGYEQIISKDIDNQQKIIEDPTVSIDKKLDAIKKLELQKTNLKDAQVTASSSRVLMSELHQGNHKKKIAEIEKAIAENPEFAKYLKSDLEKQKTLLKRSENYTSEQQKLLPNDGESNNVLPSNEQGKNYQPIAEGGDGDKNLKTTKTETLDLNLEDPDGTVKKDLVVSGNNATPEAKDAAVDQIKGMFGEMFDPKELMRMAILYLGARATGATGNQALGFAGKHYLKRIDQKHSTNKFNKHFNELNAGSNYTEDSMKLYKYLKDPNVLVAKSSNAVSYRRPEPAGEDYYLKSNTPGIRKHEKIYLDEEYQDGKKTGNKVYRTVDGKIISPAALQNYTKDKSFDKTSKEYEESVVRIQKQWEGMVNTRLNTYKPTENNGGKPKMYNLLSKNPTTVARQIALFQKDVLMNTGQNLDSTIVENAFNNIESDIDNNKLSPKVSQTVFKDYLNDAYIKAKVGDNTYFRHGKNNNETDKATDVNQTMDSLVQQVKRHGEGKWKDTPPIVINNLIMNQAKLDYQALKQRPTEYEIFQEQYNKAYKGNKQSELLYYLNNELLESTMKQVADFDKNFKKV